MPDSIIIIREKAKSGSAFTATVQFGAYGAPYDITITNPFTAEEENRLAWYFEEWLNFPFTDKVPAEQAAAGIRTYGEALFSQVFRSHPYIYLEYQRLRHEDFLLEITGSPEFHTLHWEALHDPNQDRPLAVDKLVVRKNSEPVIYRAQLQQAPMLRVLLVTARPSGARDVSYRTISRPLVEALETAKLKAQIDIVRPGTFEALNQHLENVRDDHGDGYYHMIHLDVHGALLTFDQYQKAAPDREPNRHAFKSRGYGQDPIESYDGLQAFLLFDDDEGEESGNLVNANDLARLLNSHQIPIVVLNACQSGMQKGSRETSLGSRLLMAGAQLVVAMGYSVTVSAARILMTALYRQLLAGREPSAAIRRARLELYNDKYRQAAYNQEIRLEDWIIPVVYQNTPPRFELTSSQSRYAMQATTYEPPRTTYGFMGRDLDILQIERRLLHHNNNLLLIRGMGGAGKTTLLHHLGWWWQKTRFVDQVFYFGYDIKAYHLPEIINRIGRELGLRLSGILVQDRTEVLHHLKSTRHLLILDNLESVTGERLAVPNTLPPEAQAEVRDFLRALLKGRTLVLLGSRGGEAWLRPDPLRDSDVYDLPGLDYEAQTALAEAIIKEIRAPRYHEEAEHQQDFRRLLRLLGGYPLAMEVVLANLSQATPAEVIARLQAADVDLDNKKEAAQKTESILKCIDYSHSNLSSEAQSLLLCLAPFTGVINKNWLEHYTEKLKVYPALAGFPYERWPEVLRETAGWGLLEPHDKLGELGYLRLQPTLPYFLKTRLDDETRAEQRQAIDAAFREHYNDIGAALNKFITSKEPQERQIGQVLIGVEYENLMMALHTALLHGEAFWGSFSPLYEYLEAIQDGKLRLELCGKVLRFKTDYSQEKLEGEIGVEFLLVLSRLSNTLFELKQYFESERIYHEALDVVKQLGGLADNVRANYNAVIYHQLGMVAQEQRQWEAAEEYYQKALQITIDINDPIGQAGILHQLGCMAKERRHWEVAERYLNAAYRFIPISKIVTTKQKPCTI